MHIKKRLAQKCYTATIQFGQLLNSQGPGNDFYPGGVRINKKNFQKKFYYINP